MNLQGLEAAENAVKKIVKDYKPIADLSDALDLVRGALANLGDLERLKADAMAELNKLQDEKKALAEEYTKLLGSLQKAQATYDAIKAKLAGIKL